MTDIQIGVLFLAGIILILIFRKKPPTKPPSGNSGWGTSKKGFPFKIDINP